MADKLAAAVSDVETPYVNLIPDDDIVFPHAIAKAIEFLNQKPDYTAAHGYFISFRTHDDDIDIHDVIGFTPSILDENPLMRLYNLFRRYQSFYWGVFRTEVFRSAVTAACEMSVVLFRELTVMSTSILQGKVARLPLVYALRGTAKSHAAVYQSNPLFFALHDAREFFDNYTIFRDGIAKFIRRAGIQLPDGAPLEQLLDMIFATYLGREVDVGVINYAVQTMLGEAPPLAHTKPSAAGWEEPIGNDVIHRAKEGTRRYIWRKRVLQAEPREEITITVEEMAQAERQLGAYR